MIIAFYQHTLRKRLQCATCCEIAVHRMPQDAFRKTQRFRSSSQQMRSELASMIHQIIVRNDSVRETDSLSFIRRDHFAGEDQLFGLAVSDQLHQSRTPSGAGDQPDVVFSKTKLRLIGCDSYVARQCALQAGPGARAVDRR